MSNYEEKRAASAARSQSSLDVLLANVAAVDDEAAGAAATN